MLLSAILSVKTLFVYVRLWIQVQHSRLSPGGLAKKLGLKPTGKSVVETGAGRLELERSRIWIELEGRGEIVPVLVSDIIDRVLIGVTTLEVLGL